MEETPLEQATPPGTAKCRALGHDYDFTAEGGR